MDLNDEVKGMAEAIAGLRIELLALGNVVEALIATHPDAPALLAAFDKTTKATFGSVERTKLKRPDAPAPPWDVIHSHQAKWRRKIVGS